MTLATLKSTLATLKKINDQSGQPFSGSVQARSIITHAGQRQNGGPQAPSRQQPADNKINQQTQSNNKLVQKRSLVVPTELGERLLHQRDDEFLI